VSERGRDVDRLQGEIEELITDLWQVPRFSGLRRGFRPQVDCYRRREPAELTVVVELPGVEPDDVEVTLTGRSLVLSGERRRPRLDGVSFQQVELEYGPFQRTIQLSEDVALDQVRADFRHGLLTVVLPVAEQPPQPARVRIEVRRP
jgi:HSP20 family protein